jgi:hypothetical protein
MTLRGRLAHWLVPEEIRAQAKDVAGRLAAVDAKLDAVAASLAELRPAPADPPRRGISRFEFRAHSQNGEDGILLYVFTLIGTSNRRFVEIGVEDGRECNTANLSLNFCWTGLLVDRDAGDVQRARAFYAERGADVRVEHCHVTRENVNEILVRNGMTGDIDLLSVDIDGNDYWVWEAVEAVNPRVVIVEYNSTLGWERPIVVEYDPDFARFEKHESGFYHGASLAALEKLGNRKGYCLVGCELAGVNAFFVRRDATRGRLAEVPVDEAYVPMYGRIPFGSATEQFGRISHLPFVEV